MISFILGLLMAPCFAAPHKNFQQVDIAASLRLPRALAAESLRQYGDSAQTELEAMAFDSKWPMKSRWKAFMVAVELKGKQTHSILSRGFRDATWYMRSAALTAAESYDSRQAKLWAYKAFNADRALLVRMKALEILKKSRNQKIRRLFWKKLHSSDNKKGGRSLWIRGDIARVLLQNPKKSELTRWAQLLHEKDPELQTIGAQALSQMRPDLGTPGTNLSFWKKQFPVSKKL